MFNREYFESEQVGIRCSIVRGGSSKAAFFYEHDLPPVGPDRDAFLKRAMGTPDITQIDGLGGANLLTSKIAIIAPSSRDDADVDYTFAQAEITRDIIDYTANCGNISAGVGPFAIDAGLVKPVEPVTKVRIHNTNTGNILIAHVPVTRGRARVKGDAAIAGVPGTGAEILMDYQATIGAKTGKMLPTGNVIDRIPLEDGTSIETTICDVANPVVFVRGRELGMRGDEKPDEIHANAALIRKVMEIRGKAAEAIRFTNDWRKAETESPFLPFLVMVNKPSDYATLNGAPVGAGDMDLRSWFIFFNRCHNAMAGTGSMCIAAASRIPGSVVNELVAGERARKDTLGIGHPSGVMQVRVEAREADNEVGVGFNVLGFVRTARKIMDGVVYVPSWDRTPG